MLVLIGSLSIVAVGVTVFVTRRRIQANLPIVENPGPRNLHPGSPWTVTVLGVFIMTVGAIGVVIYLIWFR